MNVLLIEEDRACAFELAQILGDQRIEALMVHDMVTAETLIENLTFDVILLNVMLVKRNNFSCLRGLRLTTNIPIILISAKGLESHCIRGLEIGADDYITRPFHPEPLVARLNAIERRCSDDSSRRSVHSLDDLRLLPGRFQAYIGGSKIELTPAECRLLRLLMTTKTNPLPRQTLYREGLFRNESPLDRSLDVHVSNLRKKLGPHPTKGNRIRSVRGLGYALIH
jgi:two-component system response regulator CpxR